MRRPIIFGFTAGTLVLTLAAVANQIGHSSTVEFNTGTRVNTSITDGDVSLTTIDSIDPTELLWYRNPWSASMTSFEGRMDKNSGADVTNEDRCVPNPGMNAWYDAGDETNIIAGAGEEVSTFFTGTLTSDPGGGPFASTVGNGDRIDVPASLGDFTELRFLTTGARDGSPLDYTVTFVYDDGAFDNAAAVTVSIADINVASRDATGSGYSILGITDPTIDAISTDNCASGQGFDEVRVPNPVSGFDVYGVEFGYVDFDANNTAYLPGPLAVTLVADQTMYDATWAYTGDIESDGTVTDALAATDDGTPGGTLVNAFWYEAEWTATIGTFDDILLYVGCGDDPGGGIVWDAYGTPISLSTSSPADLDDFVCQGTYLRYKAEFFSAFDQNPVLHDVAFNYDPDADFDGVTQDDLYRPDSGDKDNVYGTPGDGTLVDCDDTDDGVQLPNTTYYADTDGDFFGDLNNTTLGCPSGPPSGYVADSTDCDDDSSDNTVANVAALIFPGATYFGDADGDLYGDASVTDTPVTCGLPAGFSVDSTDCDDDASDDTVDNVAALIFPGATYYADTDADLYGDTNVTDTPVVCGLTVGFSVDNTDCDDDASDDTIANQAAQIFPGATYYLDDDDDQYGDLASPTTPGSCGLPVDHSVDNTDCDDADIDEKPGATWFDDDDGDSFGDPTDATAACERDDVSDVLDNTDCDDDATDDTIDNQAALIFPGATYYADDDGDLYGAGAGSTPPTCGLPAGSSVLNTDCDDDATDDTIADVAMLVFPGATYFADTDGDLYGDASSVDTPVACGLPASFSVDNTDCDDDTTDDTIGDSAALVYPGATYYQDLDGDGYGDGTASTVPGTCGIPVNHSTDSTDCIDDPSSDSPPSFLAASIFPNATYYDDVDGDGYGDLLTAAVYACLPAFGTSVDGTDCDDDDTDDSIADQAALVHPGATYYDDNDGDGYGAGAGSTPGTCGLPPSQSVLNTDCDDDNSDDTAVDQAALVFPGATYYPDADGDTYGDTSAPTIPVSCGLPVGHTVDGTDCDDDDTDDTLGDQAALIFPGATYFLDNDGDLYGQTGSPDTPGSCGLTAGHSVINGDCDDDNSDDTVGDQADLVFPGATYYQDDDGDGYGQTALAVTPGVCGLPGGHAVNLGDCDDDSTDDTTSDVAALVFPGATYYADADTDSYGDPSTPNTPGTCGIPSGHSVDNTDCDDDNTDDTIADIAALVFPGATFYADLDGDSYGDPTSPTVPLTCGLPSDHSVDNTDCDDDTSDDTIADQAALVFPGATYYADADFDQYGDPTASDTPGACGLPGGFSVLNTDCDDDLSDDTIADQAGLVFPGATYYVDLDVDQYGDPAAPTTPGACGLLPGHSVLNTDCDDDDTDDTIADQANLIFPGATYYLDDDDDQYGDPAAPTTPGSCGLPVDHSVLNTDCDDSDPDEMPGATWFDDDDGDTFGDATDATATCERDDPSDVLDSTDCDDDASDDTIDDQASLIFPGATYYADDDGDLYGAGAGFTPPSCGLPGGHSVLNTDCDDDNSDDSIANQSAFVFPGATYYADTDTDQYGDAGAPQTPGTCGLPGGHSVLSSDCDDDDTDDTIADQATLIFPGATYYFDNDADQYGDAAVPNTPGTCGLPASHSVLGTDCDDFDFDEKPGALWYPDADADTFGDPTQIPASCERDDASDVEDNTDCDDDQSDDTIPDQAALIFPGATYFLDFDTDGYGDPAVPNTPGACGLPGGHSVLNTDCDDNDIDEKPGAVWFDDDDGDLFGDATAPTAACERDDVSDVLDNTDCDDDPTDDTIADQAHLVFPGTTYYDDDDGDQYGDPGDPNTPGVCGLPFGHSVLNTDCDDDSSDDTIDDVASQIFPGATYFADDDADLYGDAGDPLAPGVCGLPTGYSVDNTDCDDDGTDDTIADQAAMIFPGATYYADDDADQYGDPADPDVPGVCGLPIGYSVLNTDCDDDNSDDTIADQSDMVFPGATYYADVDADQYGDPADPITPGTCGLPNGHSVLNTDCDDDPSDDTIADQADMIFPGATYYADADADQYGDPTASDTPGVCGLPTGFSVLNTDCDDDNSDDTIADQATLVFPGTTYYLDSDGDEYGDLASPNTPASCGLPSGHSVLSTDCDDDDSNDVAPLDLAILVHPGATYYRDADSDMYGDASDSTQPATCGRPNGFSVDNTDCDDNASDDDFPRDEAHLVYPGATYYLDFDGDKYGDPNTPNTPASCGLPIGHSVDNTDCEDDYALANPAIEEIVGNDHDDDCSGAAQCWRDFDGDTHGSFTVVVPDADADDDCTTTALAEAAINDDCDDFNFDINPDVAEIQGDGVDSDCSCIYLLDPDPPAQPGADFGSLIDGYGCGNATSDDDADGLTYNDEQLCGSEDFTLHTDTDGLSDPDECLAGSYPWTDDSDNDGVNDKLEVGFDPASPRDWDDDGIFDYFDPDDDDDGIDTIDEDHNPADGNPLNDDQDGDLAACPFLDPLGLDLWDWTVFGDIADACGPNFLDIDDDGDGILSMDENEALIGDNVDNDGDPNYLDLDSDEDGYTDAEEGDGDFDLDTTPDYLDIDSDNDGVLDIDELHEDSDTDGDNNRVDPDDDNDGVATIDEVDLIAGLPDPAGSPALFNSDGDLLPNYLDIDDDNDGILTEDEDLNLDLNWFNDNFDGDEWPDFLDDDDDNDGILTVDEGGQLDNFDGDDDPNYLDLDSDDDGYTDEEEGNVHSDLDGEPDFLDLDSDDDTVIDEDELDTDSDGQDGDDRVDPDDDGDGILTAIENIEGETDDCGAPQPVDDCDLIPNYLDLDSDGDGYTDEHETEVDTDEDGTGDYLDLDSDDDTVFDLDELPEDTDGDQDENRIDDDDDGDSVVTALDENALPNGDPTDDNTDGDALPNYLDDDDDGDTVPTLYEVTWGSNHLSTDSDGDSVPDGREWSEVQPPVLESPPRNSDIDLYADGDALPDVIDPDDDDDGIATIVEGTSDAECVGGPDGLPAYLDRDSDGDGVPDGTGPNDDRVNNDEDGDTIPDIFDCDDLGCLGDQDGDGIGNCEEGDIGTDPLRPDTDLDGVGDLEEVVDLDNPQNTDGDLLIDALDTDDDNDGIDTEHELGADCRNGGGPDPLTPWTCPDGSPPDYANTDAYQPGSPYPLEPDNIPDYLDPDDDGDGILTIDESNRDEDNDDIEDNLDPNNFDGPDADPDGDGWTIEEELAVGSDPYSADSDGDGISDAIELGTDAPDTDDDGLIDAADPDDDGDLVPTADEGDGDPDNDGKPNYLDDDSDGDGLLDADEYGFDADCDGLDDSVDADHTDGPCVNTGETGDEGYVPPALQTCEGCSAQGTGAPLAGWVVMLAFMVVLRRRQQDAA